jgi:transcriptional/translational regulatory protein YebC/TACO1
VRENLTNRGWQVETAELSFKPTQVTELTAEQKKEVIEFLQAIDDYDDTHRVHATVKD